MSGVNGPQIEVQSSKGAHVAALQIAPHPRSVNALPLGQIVLSTSQSAAANAGWPVTVQPDLILGTSVAVLNAATSGAHSAFESVERVWAEQDDFQRPPVARARIVTRARTPPIARGEYPPCWLKSMGYVSELRCSCSFRTSSRKLPVVMCKSDIDVSRSHTQGNVPAGKPMQITDDPVAVVRGKGPGVKQSGTWRCRLR